jgi:hypothetical protein
MVAVEPALGSVGESSKFPFQLGHAPAQAPEPYLDCKRRLRNAVDDRIKLEPSLAGPRAAPCWMSS